MKKIFTGFVFLISFVMVSILMSPMVNAASKDIEVTNIKVKDKSGTITVEEPTISNGEISSGIKFNEIDDFVTFELTLKNNESDKYKITSIEDNNENENIELEYDYDEDYIDENKTAKIRIKMTYKNKLVNQNMSLKDLSIKLNFEKEDGTSSNIVINPYTGDNILKYVVLFIMSGLGIFFVKTKKRIKGYKIGNIILLICIMLIPFAAIAKEEFKLSIKFSDIEIKGKFDVYNITIDSKDGSSIIIKNITYGEPIGKLPEVEKEGYTFDKWVDEEGNEITEETIIKTPIEIEAKYNIIEYDITYDLNDGNLPSDKENPNKYTVEDEITLNNPEKEGYTFAGWTSSDMQNPITSVTIIPGTVGNKSFVAHFSANEDTKYTVVHKYKKFNSNEFDVEEKEEHGATDTIVAAPIKHKDGFVDPTSKNILIKADGTASVTYEYEREVYSFSITDRTYIYNISSVDGNYQYGSELTIEAKERAGYTFKWSDNETSYERTFNINKNTELTPIYTANTNTPYVVKHYKQKVTLDGYVLVDTQNLEGTTDAPVDPAVNNYYGFISPEVQHTTIKGDDSTVVEYYYNRDSYTVTFDTNGGSEESEQTIVYEATASRPLINPIKEHNTFDDWYTDDTYETKYDFENDKIVEDTVIYAKYNLNKYTVTFDTNGGSEVQSQEIEYGSKASRPEEIPELFNHEFDDWYTDDTYETKFDFTNNSILGNTTIYAKYNDLCNGFSSDSWSTIKTNVVNNTEYYPVGCKKEVLLDIDDDNETETYKVRIANTSTPDVCTQEGYSQTSCGFVMEFVDLLDSAKMNSYGSASSVWSGMDLVTWLNGSFYDKLPTDLKSVITPTYPIVSGGRGEGSNRINTITNEGYNINKIYLASAREVGLDLGDNDYARDVNNNTRTYDYYVANNNNDARKKKDLGGNFRSWWLRTADPTDDDNGAFFAVSGIGTQTSFSASFLNYYAPVFRIGNTPEFTITFDTDGGTSIESQTVKYMGKATRPVATPNKSGMDFVNWYADASCTQLYNFDTIIIENKTIYACYEDSLPVIDDGDDYWQSMDGWGPLL